MHAVSNDWTGDARQIETGRVAAEKRKEYVLVRDSDNASWTMASKEEMEAKAHEERAKVRQRIEASLDHADVKDDENNHTHALTSYIFLSLLTILDGGKY